MSLTHGFFIIELLLTIVLVTWFMGMILRHNVGCIKQQTQALSSLNAMDKARNILESSLDTRVKQSTFLYNTIKLRLDVCRLPSFFIYNHPASLNLNCLESLAIAHITATNTSSNSPLWCIASVVTGHAS